MTKPDNMVLRTVYLPKTLDQRLRGLAFRASVSKAELMRELITEALAARGSKTFGELADVKITAKAPAVIRVARRVEAAASPAAKAALRRTRRPKAAASAPADSPAPVRATRVLEPA